MRHNKIFRFKVVVRFIALLSLLADSERESVASFRPQFVSLLHKHNQNVNFISFL